MYIDVLMILVFFKLYCTRNKTKKLRMTESPRNSLDSNRMSKVVLVDERKKKANLISPVRGCVQIPIW